MDDKGNNNLCPTNVNTAEKKSIDVKNVTDRKYGSSLSTSTTTTGKAPAYRVKLVGRMGCEISLPINNTCKSTSPTSSEATILTSRASSASVPSSSPGPVCQVLKAIRVLRSPTTQSTNTVASLNNMGGGVIPKKSKGKDKIVVSSGVGFCHCDSCHCFTLDFCSEVVDENITIVNPNIFRNVDTAHFATKKISVIEL